MMMMKLISSIGLIELRQINTSVDHLDERVELRHPKVLVDESSINYQDVLDLH